MLVHWMTIGHGLASHNPAVMQGYHVCRLAKEGRDTVLTPSTKATGKGGWGKPHGSFRLKALLPKKHDT
jgi:hypothetical protein